MNVIDLSLLIEDGDDDERDEHLLTHVAQIAAGELCPCADVTTTERGLVVVSESSKLDIEGIFKTHEKDEGYDPSGPYM